MSAAVIRNYDQLLAVVAANPGWVAFSGGVDSTLLLRALVEVDPARGVALFADSPLQSQIDRENVGRLAAQLGAQLRVVAIAPLLRPDFVANRPDRCYLCKKALYRQFQTLLPAGTQLLDGTNCDDLAAGRPGQRAIAELGVVSPLALVGLSKAEVREMARWLGLPNWNRPSSSCLATRIPEGYLILPELLRQVEAGEQLIRIQGFGHVRLRLNNGRPEDVTVELAREELEGCDFSARWGRLDQELLALGIVRRCFVGRAGVICV
jgi:uncharacterized protein